MAGSCVSTGVGVVGVSASKASGRPGERPSMAVA